MNDDRLSQIESNVDLGPEGLLLVVAGGQITVEVETGLSYGRDAVSQLLDRLSLAGPRLSVVGMEPCRGQDTIGIFRREGQ